MRVTDSSPPRLYVLVPRGTRIESLRMKLERSLAYDLRHLAMVVEFDNATNALLGAAGEAAFWRTVRPRDAVVIATTVPRLKEAAQTGAAVRRADFAEIMKGEALDLSVRQAGLSRAARVEKLVDQYSRGTSAASIEQWVRQFDQLGARHLGEVLADSIQVMTTRQVCEALFPGSELDDLWAEIKGEQVAVCILPRLSSSASTIASHASDWLPPTGKINRTFAQQFGDDAAPKRIIAIDDGIWSGYDAICTLEDLLNLTPMNPNRTRKSDGTIDRGKFETYEIEIRFGLRCDLGESAFKDFLRAHSLSNIRISEIHGQRLEVLGPSGDAARQEVKYPDVISCNLPAGLVAPLFNANSMLRELKSADLDLLDVLCTEIARVNSPNRPSAWVEANRYGTNNIGSVLTFSHSCPKAALPCFRAGGEIKVSVGGGRRKTMIWKPLFSARLNSARQTEVWSTSGDGPPNRGSS
jgi:hypothetical protein